MFGFYLSMIDVRVLLLLAATIMLSCCSQKASFDNLLSRAWLIYWSLSDFSMQFLLLKKGNQAMCLMQM